MTNNNDKKVLNVPHSADKGNTIRNVPLLRFPEFTKEWIYKTIDEIFELRNGYTPSKANQSFWNNGTIPWFRMEDIRLNGGVLYDAIQHITPEAVKGSGLFEPYSIILATTATIGEHAMIIADSLANQRFTNFKVRKSLSHRYDPYYLYYYFFRIDEWCLKNTNAGGLLSVDIPSLKRKAIYAPLLDEQTKIVKLLRLIDERIATQNKIIEDLKKLKSAIIDYAIDSLDANFMKFGYLYETAGEGGTPTTSNASFYDNGKIPFIKIDDLKKKYLVENKDFITELGLQKSSAWLVPTQSILFSNGATIGEITITTYPVCTKQGILGIVPKSNIDVEFLYYFMSSSYFKKAISRIVTEGTMKTAYLKDINNILCPIPSKEKQQEIVKIPSAINSKIDFEQSILRLFYVQKQHLLRQMFI